MEQILNFILSSLNSVPADVWLIVIETVIAALVASPVVVGLKKWLSIHSDKIMLTVTILTSMVGALAAYFINDPVFSAWLIPVQGWLVFATTQPIYRFLILPFIRRIHAEIDKAVAFNLEVKSAAIPPTGLPNNPEQ